MSRIRRFIAWTIGLVAFVLGVAGGALYAQPGNYGLGACAAIVASGISFLFYAASPWGDE